MKIIKVSRKYKKEQKEDAKRKKEIDKYINQKSIAIKCTLCDSSFSFEYEDIDDGFIQCPVCEHTIHLRTFHGWVNWWYQHQRNLYIRGNNEE